MNATRDDSDRILAPIINLPCTSHATPVIPKPPAPKRCSDATPSQSLLNRFLVPSAKATHQFDQFPVGGPSPPRNIADIQAFISFYCGVSITNALARYGTQSVMSDDNSLFGYNDTVRRLASVNGESGLPKGWLEWKFEVWRRAYSYGIRGVMTKLTLALLLTHGTLTLGFMV